MSDIAFAYADILAAANKIENLGLEYGCSAITTMGCGDRQVGHIGASGELATFVSLAAEAVGALTSQLVDVSDRLRAAGLDSVSCESDIAYTLSWLEV